MSSSGLMMVAPSKPIILPLSSPDRHVGYVEDLPRLPCDLHLLLCVQVLLCMKKHKTMSHIQPGVFRTIGSEQNKEETQNV